MAVKSNLTNMVLVLGATCLLCSGILGGAYALTKDPIDVAAKAKTLRAISEVLPPFTDADYNAENKYYKATGDNGEVIGYAIESSTVGFGGTLTLMVGVTPDGTVYSTSVLSHSETPGLGAKCTTDRKFMSQWKGFTKNNNFSVKKEGGDVDAITASTITSGAYALAVSNALKLFEEQGLGEVNEQED